jgi:hypothetical protein
MSRRRCLQNVHSITMTFDAMGTTTMARRFHVDI